MAHDRSSTPQRNEYLFVLGTVVVVLLFTTLPYAFAYVTAPPDKQFMGIMLDTPDHGQYFSWMRELANAPLAANKLTPEPNAPVFFNLLWWMLGQAGAALGVNYQVTYQVLRIVGTTIFFLAVYRLCAWFFDDVLKRRTAFLVAVLASGLGWMLVLMKYTVTRGELLNPLDVYVAEGNTLLCVMGFPHFIAAATYIFVFDLLLRGQARHRWRYAVYAGLVALFLGWQHAYDLFIIWFVIAAYVALLMLRDRKLPVYVIGSLIVIGLISCWPGLYSFLLTRLDPVWKGVLEQFDNGGVFTPPPWRLPVLMGIPLILAIFTVIADWVKARKSRSASFRSSIDIQASNNDLFVKMWFLISFALIYFPTNFQIHMLNGWQVPIAILATRSLFDYIAPLVERRLQGSRRWQPVNSTTAIHRTWLPRALVAVLIVAIVPTNLYLWAWRFTELRRHDYPYYLHNDELSAFKWIEQNAKPDDVVLSSMDTGLYLPMFTGTHAYLAHWAQTLDFFNKDKAVQRFFASDTTDAERLEILQAHGVDYVLVGPAERTMGDFDPDRSGILEPVFRSPSVTVYEVAIR